MPFDGVDLEQPSLQALSAALRDATKWPPGFRWNYCTAAGCAMGMAIDKWGKNGWDVIRDMPEDARHQIFIGLGSLTGTWIWRVRPELVADAIDLWSATGTLDRNTLRGKLPWRDRLFSWLY